MANRFPTWTRYGRAPIEDLELANKAYVDSAGGQSNTASNVGGEKEVFKQKVAVDLEFRTLKAGALITLVQNANDVEITGTAPTSQKYVLLDEEISTGTGSTLTLTMPAGMNEATYSAIEIFFSFGKTAAFDLNMLIDGVTAGIWGNQTLLDGNPTVVTYLRLAGVSPAVICGSEIVTAANYIGGSVKIILNTDDKPLIFSDFCADNTEAFSMRGNHNNATGDIAEIVISTSTSTWVDMHCRAYGIRN